MNFTYPRPRLAICTCGHTGNKAESQHTSRFAPGHGPCLASGCLCKQFTWERYVEDDAPKGLRVIPNDQ